METTDIRKQIYDIIEQYAPECSEPKKMCSSFEDIVDDLAESKVKKLDIQNVGRSALPFEDKAHYDSLIHCGKQILKGVNEGKYPKRALMGLKLLLPD